MQSDSRSAWTISSSGPTSQPQRQPVIACDFERLATVTVRSAMPGRPEIEMCGASKVSAA